MDAEDHGSATEPPQARVGVLGAGSWGTALALHAARRGDGVRLWARDPDHAARMRTERRNPRYLSEIALPPDLGVSADLEAVVRGSDLLICAVPSQSLRGFLGRVADVVDRDRPPMLLLAVKGIEVESLATMEEVAAATLPDGVVRRMAVLGGPSFAAEVAQGLPTTVVVGGRDAAVVGEIQRHLSGDGVRAYATDDLVGVELGGALKNVIALAAGVVDGAGLGHNARAGVITRGLAEITRLALHFGAHPATLAGLAGLGDLVLTCTGGLSRNRRVGLALGQGRRLPEILEELGMIAEGVTTTRSAHALAHREGIEMPIVDIMYAILYEDLGVREAVDSLMGRALKTERA